MTFKLNYPPACAGFLLLIAVFFTMGNATASDIYFYIDEDGVYHYSNAPTSTRYVPSQLEFYKDLPARSNADFDRIIQNAADAFGVEFALIKAVIKAESDFNPRAVSTAGAMGLMQIMPANLKSFKLSDPFNPEQNIQAGTRYLKQLIARYDKDLYLALAAYNAGPMAVDTYGSIPPYKETRTYVDRVLRYYDRYSHQANLSQ